MYMSSTEFDLGLAMSWTRTLRITFKRITLIATAAHNQYKKVFTFWVASASQYLAPLLSAQWAPVDCSSCTTSWSYSDSCVANGRPAIFFHRSSASSGKQTFLHDFMNAFKHYFHKFLALIDAICGRGLAESLIGVRLYFRLRSATRDCWFLCLGTHRQCFSALHHLRNGSCCSTGWRRSRRWCDIDEGSDRVNGGPSADTRLQVTFGGSLQATIHGSRDPERQFCAIQHHVAQTILCLLFSVD